jgi:hypothetical protein
MKAKGAIAPALYDNTPNRSQLAMNLGILLLIAEFKVGCWKLKSPPEEFAEIREIRG